MDMDGILMVDEMVLVRKGEQDQRCKEHLQEISKAHDLPTVDDLRKSKEFRYQEDD